MGPAARSAVPALLRVLHSGPGDRDTGHGSTGVGIVSVRSAVIEALGRIADRPGRARACRLAVLTLEQVLARRAVVEPLERQHPNRTRHVVEDAEVEVALRTLDRRSPEYLKQRQGVCRDAVAEAALRALAAIRCETCLPPIVAALQEPWLATAAPALRAVISSPSHGQLARESARVALANFGE